MSESLHDLSTTIDRYRDALERIKNTEGKVCDEFTVCSHRACNSSYSAWAIADEALNPEWATQTI